MSQSVALVCVSLLCQHPGPQWHTPGASLVQTVETGDSEKIRNSGLAPGLGAKINRFTFPVDAPPRCPEYPPTLKAQQPLKTAANAKFLLTEKCGALYRGCRGAQPLCRTYPAIGAIYEEMRSPNGLNVVGKRSSGGQKTAFERLLWLLLVYVVVQPLALNGASFFTLTTQ
jgi:hypothetical protein